MSGGHPAPAPAAPGAAIRLYDPRDRRAVRAISCETADRGTTIDPLLSDRELVADLLTSYYTDLSPATVWVVECGQGIVGYLTGCLDTRRYERVMSLRVVPRAALAAARRGTLGSLQAWKFLGAGVQTWLRGGFRPRTCLSRFPAHLHVDIRQGFRGVDLGRQLVERFLEQARTSGVPGVHARVRSDNTAACRFFEALGFEPVSRAPLVWPSASGYHTHEAVLYGRRLR